MAVVVQEQEQVELPLPFEVGEEVELRSFLKGYRGAWFRCKITNIRTRNRNRNRKGALSLQCAIKYCDFPDQRIIWTSLYEAAPVPRGSERPRTMELMLRPPFPPFHRQSTQDKDSNHQPPSSSSEATALLNSSWRLGDLVDLWCDGCFWSGTIIHLDPVAVGAVQVQLLPPPTGEGGVYKALLADLRPSLDWSQQNGWSVPLSQANGDSWYTARLVQCSPLAVLHYDSDQSKAHVGNALDPSCILCIEPRNESPKSLSAASIKALEWTQSSCLARGHGHSSASADTSNTNPSTMRFPRNKSTNENSRPIVSLDEETSSERSRDLVDNAGSTDGASTEKSKSNSLQFGRKNHSQKSRMVVCSEDEEVSTARNSERDGDAIEIEIGASIMELEEVANKIRWLKGLLRFGYSSWINYPSATWKFLANAPNSKATAHPNSGPNSKSKQ